FTQGATLTPRRFLIVETDTDQPSIGAGRGRRFVRSRTSSLDRPPWSSIEPLRGAIEDRFLRPAFLGESVLPFRVTEPLTAVVPYDGAVLMNQDSPLLDLYPGLAEWWRAVSRLWTAHRAPLSPETLLDRVDYHSGLSRQLTVRGARVVYTTSGSILSAAMVTDPDAVIDTSLYWARVHSAS